MSVSTMTRWFLLAFLFVISQPAIASTWPLYVLETTESLPALSGHSLLDGHVDGQIRSLVEDLNNLSSQASQNNYSAPQRLENAKNIHTRLRKLIHIRDLLQAYQTLSVRFRNMPGAPFGDLVRTDNLGRLTFRAPPSFKSQDLLKLSRTIFLNTEGQARRLVKHSQRAALALGVGVIVDVLLSPDALANSELPEDYTSLTPSQQQIAYGHCPTALKDGDKNHMAIGYLQAKYSFALTMKEIHGILPYLTPVGPIQYLMGRVILDNDVIKEYEQKAISAQTYFLRHCRLDPVNRSITFRDPMVESALPDFDLKEVFASKASIAQMMGAIIAGLDNPQTGGSNHQLVNPTATTAPSLQSQAFPQPASMVDSFGGQGEVVSGASDGQDDQGAQDSDMRMHVESNNSTSDPNDFVENYEAMPPGYMPMP